MYTDKQPRTRSSRTFRTEAGKSSVYVQDNRPENAVQAKLANLIQLVTDDTYVYPLREKYILVKRMLKESRGGYTDKNVADMLKEVPKKEMDMILSWDSSYIQELNWIQDALKILRDPTRFAPHKKGEIGKALLKDDFTDLDYLSKDDEIWGTTLYCDLNYGEAPLPKAIVRILDAHEMMVKGTEMSDFIEKYTNLSPEEKRIIIKGYGGNCGLSALYLYGEGDANAPIDNEHRFTSAATQALNEVCTLIKQKSEGLLKITLAQSHTFTLIIYSTQVELIQGWQGRYGVQDSLQGNTLYDKNNFIFLFRHIFDTPEKAMAVDALFKPSAEKKEDIGIPSGEYILTYSYKDIDIKEYKKKLHTSIEKSRAE